MRFQIAAGAIVHLLSAGQGWAADGPDYIKLKALLPPGENASLCLSRVYDAGHLQQHPQQKVTELLLSLRYVRLGEDEATLIATEDGGIQKQYFRYDFTLAAKVKDRTETLHASGDCASAEAIGCGVDCDGGGIELEPVEDGQSVLMRLDRIRMTLGCGGDGEIDLEGGADDKVFRLAKTSPALCSDMEARLRKGSE